MSELEEVLSKLKEKDLHTNNGDIRPDAEWRDGWNSCIRELRKLMKGETQ